MRGDESFLTRWSRRKRAVAAQAEIHNNPPPPSGAETARPVSAANPEAPAAISLPSIEAIESAWDIKAFLAPGVPLELTRAALRRAWAANPAIRDFIGLSENAWDFTAPGGVPGFGALDLQDVRRLTAQLLGEPQAADPTGAAARADPPSSAAETAPVMVQGQKPESIAATQHEKDLEQGPESRPRRHHGGALPQ